MNVVMILGALGSQLGSRLIKNLGVSGLFQDLESSEVICGVLQAAILDSCQQVLGLCTLGMGNIQTIMSYVFGEHALTRASMPKPH